MYTVTKKLIHGLIALSMLVSCIVTPALAAEENRDAYQAIPAVSADEVIGSANNGDHIGGNNLPSVIRFDNVDFGNDTTKVLTAFYMEIGLDEAGGGIDVYMDASDGASPETIRKTGTRLASITTVTTGGWSTWVEQKSEDIFISKVTGTHTLYLLFNASTCGNVKSFRFEQGEAEAVKWTLDEEISAVKYDGISVSVNNGTHIGNNNGAGYIRYDGIDFGEAGTWKEIGVEVGVANDPATREIAFYVMEDDTVLASSRDEIVNNGTKIASIATTPTGGWEQFAWQYSKDINSEISGVHSVYVVFTGNHSGNLRTILFSTVRKISAFEKIEAETAAETENCTVNADNIGGTNNGGWAKFENIDFSGGVPNYCIVKAGAPEGYANGTVEVYVDNMEDAGNLVASVQLKETEDWNAYQKNYAVLDEAAKAKLTGTKEIYLKFVAGDGIVLGNIDNFQFAERFNDAYAAPLYGEDASDWHPNLNPGTAEYAGETHTKFGSTGEGYWILYENIDFGQFPLKEFSLIYGAPEQSSDDGKQMAKINVYIDNTNSEPIYSQVAENTGGYDAFKACGPYAAEGITGLHDVYITFGYSGTCDFLGIEFTASVSGLTVMEDTLVLYDAGGEELANGQALTSNTDFVEASCTIANNSGETQDAVLILAVYTPDGKLARVSIAEDSFENGAVTEGFSTYIDFLDPMQGGEIPDTTGYVVKAMVWTGLGEGMIPLPGGSL